MGVCLSSLHEFCKPGNLRPCSSRCSVVGGGCLGQFQTHQVSAEPEPEPHAWLKVEFVVDVDDVVLLARSGQDAPERAADRKSVV